jgi:DNA topoisomerase-2
MQTESTHAMAGPVATGTGGASTAPLVTNVQASVDATITDKYVKKTQREHVYDLPDSYIGASEPIDEEILLFQSNGTIGLEKANYIPGLYKILDELIVNAWDQRIRLANENLAMKAKSKKKLAKGALHELVTRIEMSVNPETTELMVRNDGDGIDIAMHPEHQVYTVELIFGHLLTSTNYHKGDKLTGGKNGFGAKLANIFSHRFEIETVDRRTKQKYTQVFEHNMQTIHPPTIVKYTGKPYTHIKLIPDLQRFGMTTWTPAMLKLIQKRAYDLSACGGKDLTVTYNGEVVPVKDLTTYMTLFPETDNGAFCEVLGPRWEVGVALSTDGFKQMSFVNGVWTIKGGKHVDYIANQIAKQVCETIKKKKKVTVKTAHVKENLMVFVKAMIVNPSFDGQTKETLTTPSSKFGSKCELPADFMDKVNKLGLVERVLETHLYHENKKAKVTDGKKRGRISGIPKLDDANKAGGKEAYKCTLILTEGDSAKAMAIAGLSVVGRDHYGVFPLRGKMINARDKMTTPKGLEQMNNNEEMCHLKKILGLEQGREYASEEDVAKHLRYGKVMVMTDQDVDGSHIKGLFMNWIDSQWPSLMSRDFVTAMNTPIIKAKKGQKERSFYSIGQYQTWQATAEGQESGWHTKYYKGLGTSTTNEAKEYFRDLKQVHYEYDAEANEQLDMVFNNKRADDRKAWMQGYNIQDTLDTALATVSYGDFVHKELKHFSIYDTQRSVASVVDGLKPSQRKILYACFKRKLTKEIKVAQLAGYVSEHTGYHHGEQSLNMAIIGMAQTFVGSNNLNLLMPNGQFGTRLQGGKDAASPRYIFTLLNTLTSRLFHPDDQPLLEYLDDDGQKVEPRFYVPILPVALLNGVHGVGTGYSTSVPTYNPLDVCDAFVGRLKHEAKAASGAGASSMDVDSFPELHPYYNGFTGTIEKLSPTSYMTKGRYRIADFKTVEITELPIGTWTDDYKEFLETLLVDYTPAKKRKTGSGSVKNGKASKSTTGVLKHYTSHCTESTVHFILEFTPDALQKWLNTPSNDKSMDYFQKQLRLTSKISLTNMHLFNANSQIHKYQTPQDIMEAFYTTRLDYYGKRREYQLGVLRHELDILKYKVQFLEAVISDDIVVAKQSKAELEATLEAKGYPRFCTGDAQMTPSYRYLLGMPIYTLTTDTLAELRQQREDKQQALATLEGTAPATMWSVDLQAFRTEYKTALAKAKKEAEKQAKATAKARAKRAGKGKKGK